MAKEFAFFSNGQYFNEYPYIAPPIRNFSPLILDYLKSEGYTSLTNEIGCKLSVSDKTHVSYVYTPDPRQDPRMYISNQTNDPFDEDDLNTLETHRQNIIDILNNPEHLNATLDDFSFKLENLNRLEWEEVTSTNERNMIFELRLESTPILPSSFRKGFTEHLVNNHSWKPVNSDLTIFERDV